MIILFLLSLGVSVISEPCSIHSSVDISDADISKENFLVKDGVTYPSKYVYQRNVSGEIRTFACACELKKCFRKCCPVNQVMYNKTCTEMPGIDKIVNGDLSLYHYDGYKRRLDVESNEFSLLYGRPCVVGYLETLPWFVQENGDLYVSLPNQVPPWTILTPDKYCVDSFVHDNETTLDAFICHLEPQEGNSYLLTSTCMIISCVFILATCAVYAWLPELHNLHGRVLIAYLLCLFVAFSLFASMQILLLVDNITLNMCVGLTIGIYFFLLSAFFWMNVMSFDIWWTFSGKRGLSLEKLSIRGRFFAYALYAFSIPTALTVLLTALEFSGLPSHPWLPKLRQQGCFLYGKSKLIYLYGPITVLCIANSVFFILTTIKIAQIKQQTAVLKSKESSKHDQHKKDKQRLLLYVKLFAVMGINWFLEVISSFYPEANAIWRIFDAYNVLMGLTIFIIFVCKRKIYYLMKKRYKQMRGQPWKPQTTISSRVLSRDDTQIGSIKVNEQTLKQILPDNKNLT